jgi:hypothetical protein
LAVEAVRSDVWFLTVEAVATVSCFVKRVRRPRRVLTCCCASVGQRGIHSAAAALVAGAELMGGAASKSAAHEAGQRQARTEQGRVPTGIP